MYLNRLSTKGKINKSNEENSKCIIEGVMSKAVVDLENEVIGAESYADAINTIKERTAKGQSIPIFIEHRRKELSLPVGKIVDAWSDDKSLYFRGEIAGGAIGEPIRELIKGGYLYGCSIGGDAVKTTNYFDRHLNRDVKKITKMELRELSLTGLPVNSEAVFAIAKSLNKDEKEVKLLMKSLDKAIDASSASREIQALEKAVATENLDEASLQRIKGALNNLATLLQIDVSADAGAGVAPEAPVQGAPAGTQEPVIEEEAAQGTEMAPAQEETAAKVPDREVVNQNAQNDMTQGEELLQPEGQPVVEEAMVNTGAPAVGAPAVEAPATLEGINAKLNQLLEEEGLDDGMGIEKEGDGFGDGGDGEDDDSEDVEINIDADDEDDDDVEVNIDADDDDNERGFEKKKKKFPFNKKEKSTNIGGGENMEVLVCRGCKAEFETQDGVGKSYDAKFCTHCGDRLEKSSQVVDVECQDCGSVFEKSMGDDLSYCPKCGKSMDADSIAVAPPAKGADTTYTNSQQEMARGGEPSESIAVAPPAKGADTKVLPDTAKETGSSVPEIEKDSEAHSIDASDGKKTIPADSDLSEKHAEAKPMLGKFDEGKIKNYGKDKVGKSQDDKIESLEKTVKELTEKSQGRQSVVPEAIEGDKKVEKSQASQEQVDRAFAQMLIKK